jgi:hypothetical protein
VPSTSQVRISLISIDAEQSIDTYLYLRRGCNRRGSLEASDDDGGIDFNSQIERVLPSGQYLIEATSFSSAEEGEYALFIDLID